MRLPRPWTPFLATSRLRQRELTGMIESGTLGQKLYRGLILAVCGLLFSSTAWAQSDETPVPLGDLARSLRKKKAQAQTPPSAPDAPAPAAPARTTIDNDNFSQVL